MNGTHGVSYSDSVSLSTSLNCPKICFLLQLKSHELEYSCSFALGLESITGSIFRNLSVFLQPVQSFSQRPVSGINILCMKCFIYSSDIIRRGILLVCACKKNGLQKQEVCNVRTCLKMPFLLTPKFIILRQTWFMLLVFYFKFARPCLKRQHPIYLCSSCISCTENSPCGKTANRQLQLLPLMLHSTILEINGF